MRGVYRRCEGCTGGVRGVEASSLTWGLWKDKGEVDGHG